MKPTTLGKTWLPVAITLAVFAPVLLVASKPQPGPVLAERVELVKGAWPMFGGTAHRNMVNPLERNLAEDWSVSPRKNIKWVAALGSRCYSSPTVANGRVLVGTNNDPPRDSMIISFQEPTGLRSAGRSGRRREESPADQNSDPVGQGIEASGLRYAPSSRICTSR